MQTFKVMISVIMPIYNGEKYIEHSISSILKEKNVSIELILVNDGSTDSSLAICKRYASQDHRVKVINKPNGGICSARNTGLEVATGDYISFCDQDDEIIGDIYKVFSNAVIHSRCDLVIAGKELILIDEEGKVIEDKVYRYRHKNISTEKGIVDVILNKSRNIELLHLWNCLYKKEIIDKYKIRFDESFHFGMEDTMFNIEYGVHCKNIVLSDEVVYRYSRRKNISTSTKFNDKYMENYKHYVDKLFECFNKEFNGKYSIDVFSNSLRYAIKIYYYATNAETNKSNGEIWKSIYSVLLPHHSKPFLFRPSNPFFIYIWTIWLLSDLKLYDGVAKFLDVIR